jgi:hypothetical protein
VANPLSSNGNGELIPREPTEVEAAHAHALNERIRGAADAIRQLWINLAADLWEFQQGEMWRALGHGSFEAWLASPEISLERREVYRMISVHRELVLGRGVEPEQLGAIASSRVHEVLPAIRRGAVTVEQALADADVLTVRDLRQRYQGLAARTPGAPEPPIGDESESVYVTCPACGGRMAVRS